MNLTVSRNLEAISPERVPDLHPAPGRMRLLCLGVGILGLKSYAKELEAYCATRSDVQAVHVTLSPSWMQKALTRVSPMPFNKVVRVYKAIQQWRRITYRWCRTGGPLDLARFDAAIACPQFYGWGLARHKREGRRFALSLQIDATVHNTERDFGESRFLGYPLKRIEREILAQADVITGTGMWALNSAHTDYGCPRERLVWMPPIAPYYARRDRPVVRPGALPRMVFVGYDWERKGGPELLRWHQQYFSEKAELHFIGGGEKVTGAPRNVFVHGRVERQRLIDEVLPSMDFFVMPTKLEMSSWAGVEAMGQGMPVILTDIGGIPDLVIEGETGFLVKPGDEAEFVKAIGRLVSDPGLCRRMGEAARRRVEHEFTREVVYGRLIDRLKAVAGAESIA